MTETARVSVNVSKILNVAALITLGVAILLMSGGMAYQYQKYGLKWTQKVIIGDTVTVENHGIFEFSLGTIWLIFLFLVLWDNYRLNLIHMPLLTTDNHEFFEPEEPGT